MLERLYVLEPSNRSLRLAFDEPRLLGMKASCTFTLTLGSELLKEFTAYGVDEIDALQAAFDTAEANLQFYGKKLGETVTWNDQRDLGLTPACLTCGRPT
jgi:uncharacterized protein DUF6968